MAQKREFLIDIDQSLNYCFVAKTAEELTHPSFLWKEAPNAAEIVRREAMVGFRAVYERRPVNFIYHTAFCGSTMLSRALSNPPQVLVLKEPRVLFRLSEASLQISENALLPHIENVMAELSSPWLSNESIIIKPTNSCNRIAKNLISPLDKVVLLYSTLDEFLISCLKKMPEAEVQVNWMAKHLLIGSKLEAALQLPENIKFNIIEAAVVAWCLSLEYFSDLLKSDPESKFLLVRYNDLKNNSVEVIQNVGSHFEIDKNLMLGNQIKNKIANNSKDSNVKYDSNHFKAQSSYIKNKYQAEIDVGLDWARDYILPSTVISSKFKVE